ncbi:glycosyltransferase family 39 protein [Microcoleus sp. FACHB-672]|uniref:ArnT family glycosyltransferase n=1 Tax=Microcoleus sp. FACHB-672 TaxID=2692825 RepID=UPI0028167948|nr:glycosyltransferase family 39 protein [Microcoleus sp. FACHB-672]
MYREIFTLDESHGRDRRTDRRLEQLWVLGLFLAAVLLYGMNLGELPLRDWDEGIVAQVARDIWRGDLNWLYPTLAGQPYFNKPPLVHLLIAIAYKFGGVSEWTTRWPPAMLCAMSVPLLYWIGREVFPRRTPALFAALSYLTLLPVVRHGRLAMLDGPVLCFFLLMVWCLLRTRRDLRWALGAGIGLGLICLTKGILGLLLGAIAAIFIAWDTPRLLKSGYMWIGLLLGLSPAIAWYVAQWQHYDQQFITAHLINQSFNRISGQVEGNTGPPWYYLLEILKYSWPWGLFWPQGLRLAWENRNMGWAKLVLVWSGVYLLAISLMSTKLPWYVLPVYPALALAGGAQLAEIWHRRSDNYRLSRQEASPFAPDSSVVYSRRWVVIFALLAIVGWAGCLYFGWFAPVPAGDLQLTLGCFGLTMSVVALLTYRQNPQFILILFWGTYVSLTLFTASNHWVWELGEDYPVKSVAQIIAEDTPKGKDIYTSHPYSRPSLDFYSDRKVIPAELEELRGHWQNDSQPYLLLDRDNLKKLDLKEMLWVGSAGDWTLVTRDHPKKDR